MNGFAVLLFLAIISAPFFVYWLNSRRASGDFAQVLQQGFAPTAVCEFLSSGHKIAFDSVNQKVAFINMDFQTYSNDASDGRHFNKHRLTDVLSYSMIERISVNRAKVGAELDRSGLVIVRLKPNELTNSYGEASMGFSQHDTQAIAALEIAWPALVRVNP